MPAEMREAVLGDGDPLKHAFPFAGKDNSGR